MLNKKPTNRYCQVNVLQTKWDALAERWHRLLRAYRFLPDLKRLGPQNAIVDCLDQMAAKTKQIVGESVQRQVLLHWKWITALGHKDSWGCEELKDHFPNQ